MYTMPLTHIPIFLPHSYTLVLLHWLSPPHTHTHTVEEWCRMLRDRQLVKDCSKWSNNSQSCISVSYSVRQEAGYAPLTYLSMYPSVWILVIEETWLLVTCPHPSFFLSFLSYLPTYLLTYLLIYILTNFHVKLFLSS